MTGLLVLEVPNSDCFTRRLCGVRWKQFDIPRHLQHFTPATMEQALMKLGLRPFIVKIFTSLTSTWCSTT